MALIPRGKEAVRMQYSAPVAVGSTNDARVTGESIAHLGEAVAQFGKEQQGIERNLSQAEFVNDAENIMKEATEFARKNYSEKDGSDYGNKFYAYAQPKLDESLGKHTGLDPVLRSTLGSYLSRVKADMASDVTITMGKLKEENNYNRLFKVAQDGANRVRGDERLLESEVSFFGNTLNNMVTDGGLSTATVEKIKKVQRGMVAQQMIEGLEDRKQFGRALNYLGAVQGTEGASVDMDPQQARDTGLIDDRELADLVKNGTVYKMPLLTGVDKKDLSPAAIAIFEEMTPAEKANWTDKLLARTKEHAETSMADLHANLQGFQQLVMEGEDVGKYTKDLKAQINANQRMTLSARRRAMDMVNSGAAVSKQIQLAAITPHSEWSTVLDNLDEKMNLAGHESAKYDSKMADINSDLGVIATRLAYKKHFYTALEKLKQKQHTDAGQSVLNSFKELQMLKETTKDGNPESTRKFNNALLNKEAYLGIAVNDRRLLTDNEAYGLAEGLKSMPDSSSKDLFLNKLEQQHGEHFPQVLNEMAAIDKDLKDFTALAFVPPGKRARLVDAIQNKKAIEEAINKNEAFKTGEVSKIINVGAIDRLGAVNQALGDATLDSSSVEINNSLRSNVELQVKAGLAKNPSAKVSELLDTAYNDVVGSHYNPVIVGGSSALVPKQINGVNIPATTVAQFMVNHNTPETLAKIGVDVKDIPTKWVTDKHTMGIKLIMTKNGQLFPVYNKQGKQVVFSYMDILNSSAPEMKGASPVEMKGMFR
jgi:hypothetical protein